MLKLVCYYCATERHRDRGWSLPLGSSFTAARLNAKRLLAAASSSNVLTPGRHPWSGRKQKGRCTSVKGVHHEGIQQENLNIFMSNCKKNPNVFML